MESLLWQSLLVAICIGVIPAFIAHSKGRSFVAWWFYGAALFIAALPHSLIIKPDAKQIEREQLQSGNNRKCPFCAEIIKVEARVCRFCGRDLPEYKSDADAAVSGKLVEPSERTREAQINCATCKFPNPPDAMLCINCGSLVRPTVQPGAQRHAVRSFDTVQIAVILVVIVLFGGLVWFALVEWSMQGGAK